MCSRRTLRNQLLRELALEPSEAICFLAKLFDESESFAVGGFLLSLAIELYNCLHEAASSQISVEESLQPIENVLSMVSYMSVFGEGATRDLFNSFKGMCTYAFARIMLGLHFIRAKPTKRSTVNGGVKRYRSGKKFE